MDTPILPSAPSLRDSLYITISIHNVYVDMKREREGKDNLIKDSFLSSFHVEGGRKKVWLDIAEQPETHS